MSIAVGIMIIRFLGSTGALYCTRRELIFLVLSDSEFPASPRLRHCFHIHIHIPHPHIEPRPASTVYWPPHNPQTKHHCSSPGAISARRGDTIIRLALTRTLLSWLLKFTANRRFPEQSKRRRTESPGRCPESRYSVSPCLFESAFSLFFSLDGCIGPRIAAIAHCLAATTPFPILFSVVLQRPVWNQRVVRSVALLRSNLRSSRPMASSFPPRGQACIGSA
jgi:hypothetical protein